MKRILALALAFFVTLAIAQVNTYTLISAATGTGAGTARDGTPGNKTYQATGTTSAGAGAATILVQCSNNNTNWDTLGTITLVLSTSGVSDSFASSDRCRYLRGNVTVISGTGAAVSLTAGF